MLFLENDFLMMTRKVKEFLFPKLSKRKHCFYFRAIVGVGVGQFQSKTFGFHPQIFSRFRNPEDRHVTHILIFFSPKVSFDVTCYSRFSKKHRIGDNDNIGNRGFAT